MVTFCWLASRYGHVSVLTHRAVLFISGAPQRKRRIRQRMDEPFQVAPFATKIKGVWKYERLDYYLLYVDSSPNRAWYRFLTKSCTRRILIQGAAGSRWFQRASLMGGGYAKSLHLSRPWLGAKLDEKKNRYARRPPKKCDKQQIVAQPWKGRNLLVMHVTYICSKIIPHTDFGFFLHAPNLILP